MLHSLQTKVSYGDQKVKNFRNKTQPTISIHKTPTNTQQITQTNMKITNKNPSNTTQNSLRNQNKTRKTNKPKAHQNKKFFRTQKKHILSKVKSLYKTPNE